MNFPCSNKVLCPPDGPFANFSSEAPDIAAFFAVAYAVYNPPIGSSYQSIACVSVASGNTSPEQVQLAAQLTANICAQSTSASPVNGPTPAPPGKTAPNSPPVPPPQANFGGAAFPVFVNDDQVGTAPCGDGTTFQFTVPAGQFTGRSQLAADTAAQTYAKSQAQLHKLCLSTIPDQICNDETFSATIFANSSFVGDGTGTNWSIDNGLPDGLVFTPDGNSAKITGKPNTVGDYMFVVTVTLANGDTASRPYTLIVADITNFDDLPDAMVGVPYAATIEYFGFTEPTFSIIEGSLPDGLSMDGDGNISGTPAADAVDSEFTVEAFDSETGLVCADSCAIAVVPNGINFNDVVWDDPPDSSFTDGTGEITISNAQNSGEINCLCPNNDSSNSTGGNSGAVTFDGPAQNCVFTVDLLNYSPGVAGNEAGGFVSINDGMGNILFQQDIDSTTPLGINHFPFTLPPHFLNPLFVVFFCTQCVSAPGQSPAQLHFSFTVTPAH